jgi:inosine-uridine nucleoside N-ribohydrolase
LWTVDGQEEQGGREREVTFDESGVHRVVVEAEEGPYSDSAELLVRVHNAETLGTPQVLLDTDQKNEQDDQHYLGYGLFSELDILGVNSVHHGGGQEPMNYEEILHIIDLSRRSGLPEGRVPLVFRGADAPLGIPRSLDWRDTEPIETEASEAILAAARGADPGNPVWVVPVGPGTNVASAVLTARREGLDLDGRLRVMWLGGSNTDVIHEFNGGNDPWSIYVLAQSGIELWIVPAPVGARVAIDVTTEAELYPDNPLGDYLEEIVPRHNKPLFDPSCLSAIISLDQGLGWIREVESVEVAGPREGYTWSSSDADDAVRVIREIDQEAMKKDLFDTLRGDPRVLTGPAEPTAEGALTLLLGGAHAG